MTLALSNGDMEDYCTSKCTDDIIAHAQQNALDLAVQLTLLVGGSILTIDVKDMLPQRIAH
jgi:hypothetical protein